MVEDHRHINERDKARDDGDRLAVAVKSFLLGRGKRALRRESLNEALAVYCKEQGWMGPAGSWVTKPHP